MCPKPKHIKLQCAVCRRLPRVCRRGPCGGCGHVLAIATACHSSATYSHTQMPSKVAKAAFTVAGADPAQDKAPAPSKMATPSGSDAIPHIDELDVSKLEIGTNVLKGNNGDRYIEMKYNPNGGLAGRFGIEFAKLPEFVRSPFKAGPAINKETKEPIGKAWSIAIEMTPRQADKWIELENKLIEHCTPMRNEVYPPKTGRNGEKELMDEKEFEKKFNSLLRPADHDKGYPATLRISVQHEAVDENGNTRTMPKIYKTHYKPNRSTGKMGCTRPSLGNVHDDLDRGAALALMAMLSRGVYFCGAGWGIKMSLTQAYNIKNLIKESGPQCDTSNVDWIDEETPDDGQLAIKRQRTDEPFTGDDQFTDGPTDEALMAITA